MKLHYLPSYSPNLNAIEPAWKISSLSAHNDLVELYNGDVYQLPLAEYYYSGNQTISQIKELANGAAAKTKRKAGIVIAEATIISWSGLDIVKEKAY